jgi:cell division transport system ATP-binding protein
MEFSNAPVLNYHQVSIHHGDICTLSDVTFSIGKGEFVYLIGRTGSGKSSLMKSIYADLPIVSGSAEVATFNLTKLPSRKVPLLRRKLGIVFQDFQLLLDRTVADNLYFVLKATGWKNKAKMVARVHDVLLRVGLSTSLTKYPLQLSGGEQQRVVIARALLNEPQLLIADEPTGNLDPEVADDILKLFIEINKVGTGILMATHNLQFLERYPARTLVCKEGSIHEKAPFEAPLA